MPITVTQPRIINMNNALYLNQNFYTSIAHLFYAVAMADRSISREEKQQIVAFVKKYWTKNMPDLESDTLIYKTLRDLISSNTEAPKAFLVFSEYYYRNAASFDKPLKPKLIVACDAIATKKGKRSKMELILLTRLQTILYPSGD